MKYTTIKGTTIAGDVPCETDGWVRKSDLRKVVAEMRYTANIDGVAPETEVAYNDCADEIDKLLEGE